MSPIVKEPYIRLTIQTNADRQTMINNIRRGMDVKDEDDDYIDVELPAIQFDSSQLYMEGSVQHAVNEGESSSSMNIDVTHLPKFAAEAIEMNGLVFVDAGYRNSVEERIFTGQMSWALPKRTGSETKWKLMATVNTTRITNLRIHRKFRGEWTIGRIMEELARTVGAKVNAPDTAFGDDEVVSKQDVTVIDYTARRTFKEEMRILTNWLISRTGRLYKMAPDWETEPYSWRIIEEVQGTTDSAPDGQYIFEDNVIVYDYSVQTVYSAGISPTREAKEAREENIPSFVEITDWIDAIYAAEDADVKMEYRASVAFDPKVGVGDWVYIIDEDAGNFLINISSVNHNIGGHQWVTNFSGIVHKGSVKHTEV